MNEQSIFLAAIDIADPTQRASYLDQACAGNPALRKQVDELLAAHERSGQFLDVPALQQMVPRLAGAETCAEHESGGTEIDLSFLAPPLSAGSLGRMNHYDVREVIGRGGCGIVLRAFDEKLERIVAIKIMAPELAATSPARKRFLREARAAAAIRHENVISIYAVEEQPRPFLVMEYIDGETLQQRIDRTGPLDVQEVLRIGQQIASGLAAAHEKGLVHRDIKPANILLEHGTHHLKITDFGLARSADDASMTQSGVIAGTPLYMSPEQAQARDIDHRSDLFSLGSVLYVMCSGRPPFRAPSTLAVMKRVVEEQPRPLQNIIPEVPDRIVSIIARLHAKAPEERFTSAQEVAALLAACLAEHSQRGSIAPADPGGVFPQREGSPPGHDRSVPAAGQVRRPAGVNRLRRFTDHRWATAAAAVLLLVVGLGMTEATGVTNVGGTVIRLFSPGGTLVVEVDDPGVSVSIDGEDMVITGTGAQEIRLKPGQYKLLASKDGKVVRQELVTVTNHGRQVVRVSREAAPATGKAQASAEVDRKPTYVKGGDWRIDGTELVQMKPGNAVLLFGDDKWTDYDFSVETLTVPTPVTPGANKNQGGNHYFRATSQNDYLNFSLGAYYGTANEVCYMKGGRWGRDGTFLKTVHVENHWYKVRVEVRGAQVRCHLDGELVFAFKDDRFPTGGIGLATWNSVVRWRNLKVTAPDGRVLWEGFPELPTSDRHAADPSAPSAANDQAEKVRQELRRRNPDFKGAITFLVEGGQVVRWSIVDGMLADLSPLLGLEHLQNLNYAAFDPQRDAPVVRRLTSLVKINEDSAVSYRLAYPADKPPPGVRDEWLATVSKLPVNSRVKVVIEKLQEQNPNFDGKYAFRDTDMFLTFDSRAVTDLSPLAALPELRQLVCSVPFPDRSWLSDLSPLSGMLLTRLECERTRVVDLSPLKGMPLTKLDLTGTPVSDLTPLEGMPLAWCDLVGTRVEDLAPLAGMRLTRFDLGGVAVADLSPLKGMPLEYLNVASSKVADLSPLQGAPLRYLNCWGTPVADLAPLKGMPLHELYCFGTRVADLSPLKGMPLTRLECGHSRVSDLSPLRGMALRHLNVRETQVTDLSPLAGSPLVELYCANSSISDLSPLEGLRLTHLEVKGTTVRDLSPLKDMPLESLWIPDVPAEHLQAIRGIESLKQINGKPAAEFWKQTDAP